MIEVPDEIFQSFAARLYLEETGYDDLDRYENTFYKRSWEGLARRLLSSPEGQALLQDVRREALTEASRVAIAYSDTPYDRPGHVASILRERADNV